MIGNMRRVQRTTRTKTWFALPQQTRASADARSKLMPTAELLRSDLVLEAAPLLSYYCKVSTAESCEGANIIIAGILIGNIWSQLT